ncbi:oxidative damage protection protein [Buchnera aphidicola]|uniref:oxidative damage protection protein n=1 Tax=Buchnera aphidicola TaxID=9 RepID=UPI00094C4A36|nr:oxidative damage protection protein [Buchnera aphidicola]
MIFSQKILNWYHLNGRKNLPWKKDKNIYNIWISEIMLQRTQVNTVIPYYKKFIKIFPTLKKLSKAPIKKILYLWSGLGFYQRAHNIYKTTQIIINQYQGIFPNNISEIKDLPGIGQSTAHAILSFSKSFCYPILDTNIKRILIRYNFSLKKKSFSDKELWRIINILIPIHNAEKFNQGMMDLGALICHSRKPICISCPLKGTCNYYKIKKLSKIKITLNNSTLDNKKTGINFLILYYKHFILLQKQKIQKFWKSLFFFPINYFSIKSNIWKKIQNKYKIHKNIKFMIPPFIHYCSHIKLYINSYIIYINHQDKKQKYSKKKYLWYNIDQPSKIGIPAPVSKIIQLIKKNRKNIMKKIKTRTIFCTYLKKNMLGLDYQFYPGQIGEKIYNEISQEAWQLWIKEQTKIINEKKLNMFLEKDRDKLEKEMIKFLF